MMINEFEHVCQNCKNNFFAAALSDFSYGEFLLWSESGECRYLNAFDDSTYQEVIDLARRAKHDGAISFVDESKFIQTIYGELACDLDSAGSPFYIGSPKCSKCGSTKIESVASNPISQDDVEAITHDDWNIMSYENKYARLVALASRK